MFLAIGVWLVIANSGAYKLQFQGLEPEYAKKVKLTAHEAPAGAWESIKEDVRDREWDRVCGLVGTRIGMLKDRTRYEEKLANSPGGRTATRRTPS